MSNLTRSQIMLLLGCALALITVGIGVYGLVRGPGGTHSGSPTAVARQIEAPTGPALSAAEPDHRALPQTNDPVAYARAVAASLFDWDTSAGFLPADYTSAVLADADPSGEETPDLIDDAATYLPTVDQWLDLAAMDVTQSIEVDDAYVPRTWPEAVQQAHGQLRPGTTAVTITGTRHRSGVWNGENADSAYPVSFTIFVACRPSFDRCHILRLSQLDNPLR